MSVDTLDRIVVGDRNVARRNSHEFAMFLVGLVDRQITLTLASLQQQPQVGERGKTSARDVAQMRASEIRDEKVGDYQGQQNKWGILC